MFDTKPIWASRTVLGVVVMLAGLVASAFGYKVDEQTQDVIIDQLDAIITAGSVVVGAVIVIYSRLKATKRVTLTGKP